MKRPSSGFTLIEMLVVLIITALVSGVLFQALERSYNLQRRFGAELFKTQQGQMAVDWYRQSVQGLYPDYPGQPGVFKGDETGLAGLTTTPLSDNFGMPTPFRWSLVEAADKSHTDLVYREGGAETVILSWQGSGAKFSYIDAERVAHERWPPPLGVFPQLPRQVQVEARDSGEPIVIVATPLGPTEPPVRPMDVFNVIP